MCGEAVGQRPFSTVSGCAAEKVEEMRPNDTLIVATFGVMAVLLAAVVVANGIFLSTPTADEIDVVATVLSPDRQLTASIVRMKPKTAEDAVHDNVVIHRAGEDPTLLTDGARSVFDQPLDENDLEKVRWLDAMTLEIRLDERKAPPQGLKSSVGPVRIVLDQ